jgi:methyl-accepting chemotaxis protein
VVFFVILRSLVVAATVARPHESCNEQKLDSIIEHQSKEVSVIKSIDENVGKLLKMIQFNIETEEKLNKCEVSLARKSNESQQLREVNEDLRREIEEKNAKIKEMSESFEDIAIEIEIEMTKAIEKDKKIEELKRELLESRGLFYNLPWISSSGELSIDFEGFFLLISFFIQTLKTTSYHPTLWPSKKQRKNANSSA